jgi:LysM repeat protein
MNYATEHNVYPSFVDFSYFQDSIKIARQKLSLRRLAAKTNVEYETLRKLNPELKRGVVPYTEEPYKLRVPNKVARLVMNNSDGKKIQLSSLKPIYNKVGKKEQRVKTVYHEVKSGQSLQEIADAYEVSPQQIKEWNRFWAYNLKPGHELKIRVSFDYEKENNNVGSEQASKNAAASSSAEGESGARQKPYPSPRYSSGDDGEDESAADHIYHKVQPNDTWETVAEKYNTTVEYLRQLNDMEEGEKLEPGSKLKIQ